MTEPILAAGGLLERRDGERMRIAVCRRTRYEHRDGSRGDWVLPKGKPDPGEGLEETALREVEEETGWSARIVGPETFRCEYDTPRGDRKVSTFWRMEAIREEGRVDETEIAEVAWMTPAAAFGRLTYDGEREILRAAYPDVD